MVGWPGGGVMHVGGEGGCENSSDVTASRCARLSGEKGRAGGPAAGGNSIKYSFSDA